MDTNPRRARPMGCGLLAGLALASGFAAGPASAAYLAALSFVEPTGTVGSTDSIPVWIRLTLDAGSDPLDLNNDPNASPPFGVPTANYPASFYSQNLYEAGFTAYELVSVDSLSYVGLNTSFYCNNTFTSPVNSCAPGAYSFDFNVSGPDTINYVPVTNGGPTFTVQPGGSHDYLFGTFTPTGGGPVEPGNYYFYGSSLDLYFVGTGTFRIQQTDEQGFGVTDEFGNPVYLPDLVQADFTKDLRLAVTPCADNDVPECPGAFSRTVAAVPAPGALWLLGTGVGALAWRGRRQLKASAA